MPNEKIGHFWAVTRTKLDQVPMNPRIEELTPSDPMLMDTHVRTRTVHEVTLTSFENIRIRAWYLVPAGEPPAGGWPAIMELPPYKEQMHLPLHLALHGFATLSLFPRGQSISRKEWEVNLENKVVHNVVDPDKYYYRGAYMDCVRGMDFLCGRPEINKNRIGTWGFSAGGGLSLVTAALDRRVGAAVAGVPWPCDFQRGSGASAFPFVQVRNYLEQNPAHCKQALETLEYFDVVNLVDAIACPRADRRRGRGRDASDRVHAGRLRAHPVQEIHAHLSRPDSRISIGFHLQRAFLDEAPSVSTPWPKKKAARGPPFFVAGDAYLRPPFTYASPSE